MHTTGKSKIWSRMKNSGKGRAYMEIIFNEERKPGESIIEKMYQAAKLCLEEKGFKDDRFTVSVTFISSEEMRELNRLYRGIDRVTDVLSFQQFESPDDFPAQGELLLGDVVICTEQALLQADDFGHSPERELVYLFVHSILHLLGHDHDAPDEKKAMRIFEEKIMDKLGLAREEME